MIRLGSYEFWSSDRGRWVLFTVLAIGFLLIPRPTTIELSARSGFVVVDDGSFPGQNESFLDVVRLSATEGYRYEFFAAPLNPPEQLKIVRSWKKVASSGSDSFSVSELRFVRIAEQGTGSGQWSDFRAFIELHEVPQPTHIHLGDGMSCENEEWVAMALEGRVRDAKTLCLESLGASP